MKSSGENCDWNGYQETEYIAIRENNKRRAYVEQLKISGPQGQKLADLLCSQYPGQSFGAVPNEITPESVRSEIARGRAINPNTAMCRCT